MSVVPAATGKVFPPIVIEPAAVAVAAVKTVTVPQTSTVVVALAVIVPLVMLALAFRVALRQTSALAESRFEFVSCVPVSRTKDFRPRQIVAQQRSPCVAARGGRAVPAKPGNWRGQLYEAAPTLAATNHHPRKSPNSARRRHRLGGCPGIKERFDQTGDNAVAVEHGLRRTGAIITGAAGIMVAVFGGFAVGDLPTFQQMGFGLAVSVILDATIVRCVLVPSTMELLGDRNWYLPRWLEWLPRVDIEGRDEADSAASTVRAPGYTLAARAEGGD